MQAARARAVHDHGGTPLGDGEKWLLTTKACHDLLTDRADWLRARRAQVDKRDDSKMVRRGRKTLPGDRVDQIMAEAISNRLLRDDETSLGGRDLRSEVLTKQSKFSKGARKIVMLNRMTHLSSMSSGKASTKKQHDDDVPKFGYPTFTYFEDHETGRPFELEVEEELSAGELLKDAARGIGTAARLRRTSSQESNGSQNSSITSRAGSISGGAALDALANSVTGSVSEGGGLSSPSKLRSTAQGIQVATSLQSTLGRESHGGANGSEGGGGSGALRDLRTNSVESNRSDDSAGSAASTSSRGSRRLRRTAKKRVPMRGKSLLVKAASVTIEQAKQKKTRLRMILPIGDEETEEGIFWEQVNPKGSKKGDPGFSRKIPDQCVPLDSPRTVARREAEAAERIAKNKSKGGGRRGRSKGGGGSSSSSSVVSNKSSAGTAGNGITESLAETRAKIRMAEELGYYPGLLRKPGDGEDEDPVGWMSRARAVRSQALEASDPLEQVTWEADGCPPFLDTNPVRSEVLAFLNLQQDPSGDSSALVPLPKKTQSHAASLQLDSGLGGGSVSGGGDHNSNSKSDRSGEAKSAFSRASSVQDLVADMLNASSTVSSLGPEPSQITEESTVVEQQQRTQQQAAAEAPQRAGFKGSFLWVNEPVDTSDASINIKTGKAETNVVPSGRCYHTLTAVPASWSPPASTGAQWMRPGMGLFFMYGGRTFVQPEPQRRGDPSKGRYRRYPTLACNELWSFTPSLAKWQNLTDFSKGSMPGKRSMHSCGAVKAPSGTQLVLFGGLNAHNHPCNDLFVLDGNTLTWSEPLLQGVPPPLGLGAACVTELGRDLIVTKDKETPPESLEEKRAGLPAAMGVWRLRLYQQPLESLNPIGEPPKEAEAGGRLHATQFIGKWSRAPRRLPTHGSGHTITTLGRSQVVYGGLGQVAEGGGHGDIVTMALGTVKQVGDFTATSAAATTATTANGAFANPMQGNANPEALRAAAVAEKRMKRRRKRDLRRRANELRLRDGDDGGQASISSSEEDDDDDIDVGIPRHLGTGAEHSSAPKLPGIHRRMRRGRNHQGGSSSSSWAVHLTEGAVEGGRVRNPLRDGVGAGSLGGVAVGDASASGLRKLLCASESKVSVCYCHLDCASPTFVYLHVLFNPSFFNRLCVFLDTGSFYFLHFWWFMIIPHLHPLMDFFLSSFRRSATYY